MSWGSLTSSWPDLPPNLETTAEPSDPSTPPVVDVRQQLAADRTLLAWLRTSIALAALGFVVARFHLLLSATAQAGRGHGARVLGVIIVVGAVVVGLIGMYQYRQVSEMLAAHGELSQTSKAPAVVASLVVLVVLVGLTVYLAAGFR